MTRLLIIILTLSLTLIPALFGSSFNQSTTKVEGVEWGEIYNKVYNGVHDESDYCDDFISDQDLYIEEAGECLIDEVQVEAFEEFLWDNFISSVTSNPLNFNNYVLNPEYFGITEFDVSWDGYITLTRSEESIAETLDWIETFESFDREALTPLQQQSYDILAWQVESVIKSMEAELYYFRSRLKGSSGIHQLLPLLLAEYNFNNIQNIEDYLLLLSELNVVFQDAIALEEIRLERGLVLSDRILEEIIDGAKRFIDNTKDNLLLVSFELRLSEIDFLTEEETSGFVERNNNIFHTYVVPAYENLISELQGFKGNSQEDLGVMHFTKGSDFYRLRFRSIGSTYTPDQWFDIFDERIREVANAYLTAMFLYPDFFDYFGEDIHPFDTPEEILEFLLEESANSFATLPSGVTYEIKRIDESLGSFAAGFYLIPQLDNYLDNVIYYNADFADSNAFMYSLMAHEGIGHLLQFTTVFSNDLPYFRKLNTLGFTANVEGWAMHAQLYSYNFLDLPAAHHIQLVLWDEITFLLGAVVDVGVNYKGWSLEDSLDYLNSIPLFTDIPDEYLEDLFFTAVSNPARAIPYAAGLIEMRTLKEHFQEILGEDFNLKDFNEAFLSKAPAPFPLVRKWMENVLVP